MYIAQFGKTIVDTARVEVEFLAATDQSESKFLTPPKAEGDLPDGITAIRQHRITG